MSTLPSINEPWNTGPNSQTPASINEPVPIPVEPPPETEPLDPDVEPDLADPDEMEAEIEAAEEEGDFFETHPRHTAKKKKGKK
jgi:hypothetical protein